MPPQSNQAFYVIYIPMYAIKINVNSHASIYNSARVYLDMQNWEFQIEITYFLKVTYNWGQKEHSYKSQTYVNYNQNDV